MTKCATTTATVAAPKATRKGIKGPNSKDLRAAFVVAYDALQALTKVRTAANRESRAFFDAVAGGYSADPAVVADATARITEAAETAAARIADVAAMTNPRLNAEDAKAAGVADPQNVNGTELARILRETIGNGKVAKTTAERLRG